MCVFSTYTLFAIINASNEVVPMILEDTRMKMQSWGAAGTFDPFDKIYEASLTLFVCAGRD